MRCEQNTTEQSRTHVVNCVRVQLYLYGQFGQCTAACTIVKLAHRSMIQKYQEIRAFNSIQIELCNRIIKMLKTAAIGTRMCVRNKDFLNSQWANENWIVCNLYLLFSRISFRKHKSVVSIVHTKALHTNK